MPALSEEAAGRARAADERAWRADERERLADERDARAEKRERVADDREALADDREREADEREVEQTLRQHHADEREEGLDERGRALGALVHDIHERTLENISRSRELLGLRGQRLNRGEAAVRRTQAHAQRRQAAIDRASADTERELGAWVPDPGTLAERAAKLREQARNAIRAFAASEDEIARLHEEMAARDPERGEQFLRTAAQARATARRAREISRDFAG